MIRVIAIGSPFGDDRAAWEVVGELETLSLPGVDLVTLNQPGASLVGWFENVRDLYLIDTLVDGNTTGPFVELSEDDLDRTGTGISTHGQQLCDTLKLAKTLDQLPARLEIYAVVVRNPDPDKVGEQTRDGILALTGHLARRLKQ